MHLQPEDCDDARLAFKKLYIEIVHLPFDPRVRIPDYPKLFSRYLGLEVITLQFTDRCMQWIRGQGDSPVEIDSSPDEWDEDR